MKKDGFSIVELLIVLVIMGVCAAMGAGSIANVVRKNRVENQTRRIYSDLMSARTRAMSLNRIHWVVISGTQAAVYEDTNDSGGAREASTVDLQVLKRDADTSMSPINSVPSDETVTWNNATPITINGRGVVSAGSQGTLCVDPTVPTLEFTRSCIVVSRTRMALGLRL